MLSNKTQYHFTNFKVLRISNSKLYNFTYFEALKNVGFLPASEHKELDAETSDDDDNVDRETPITNQIRISGLPWNMSHDQLFDALFREFSTVGQIKMDQRTRKALIFLFKRRKNKARPAGTAKITYEKEQSAMEAIAKYNGTRVPTLNDVQIHVEQWKEKENVVFLPTSSDKQPKPKQSHTVVADDAKMPITNQIHISGLPFTMPDQVLFDTLWDLFSTVGQIKIDQRTRKPFIFLFKRKDNKTQLAGTAKITYEEKQAATDAIAKYDRNRVPILNNAQILVKEWKMKTSVPPPTPLPLTRKYLQQ
ncbi:unnamed protein product [Rotaria sp. Silwood1]|nr:unnamed protein product [Rotaria sp. Silwood1]